MKVVKRTERIWLKNSVSWMQLAHQVKNLYNVGNYVIKYQLDHSNYFTAEYELMNILRYHPAFRALPGHTAQQTLKFLCKAWKSYFRALKEWKKNPKKFKAEPKPPKYKKKNGFATVYFTNSQVKIKKDPEKNKNFIFFPKRVGGKVETRLTPETKIKFARLIPKGTSFLLEIIYEKEINIKPRTEPQRVLALDLGVNNLVAGITNINNERGFLINGRPLKSLNQWFNKEKARLQSNYDKQELKKLGKAMRKLLDKRWKRINDYMHKASRMIMDYCKRKDIDTIVIGYNPEWKQNVNMGKRNNQSFVNIPFLSLINKISYKAEEEGITVKIVDESYTSKCSFIDNEPIHKHLTYLGSRVRRGLFKSSKGLLINADINSAGNIGRKVFPLLFSFGKNYGIAGAVVHPYRWNIT